MASSVSRVKTWAATEDVSAADLNAEFDNILNNLDVATLDDYSVNVAEMQTTFNPGTVGAENKPTTLAEEIAALRFIARSITGKDEWYEAPSQTIESLASSGGGTPSNSVQSGRSRTGSSQLIALTPAGSGNGRTVTVKGATTNFVYTIENTQYTITTDVASSAITAAASSNNTALVDDASADDSESTKYFGEYGSSLIIDTAGTEITSRTGQLAGFKINNGSADEFFIARIKSATELTEIRRGYFFDDSDAPVPRVAIANNDTITILNLTWIFASTAGALIVSSTEPIWDADEPGSPGLGQYWFDLVNDKWKTYNGSAFVDADATLIGWAVTDDTDTVGARTADKFIFGSSKNTMELEVFDNSQVRVLNKNSEADIYGSEKRYEDYLPRWDMDDDRDTGVSESASTTYYLYLDEDGDEIISDLAPMDRRADYQSLYHPYHTWRCIGQAYNNASSNLEAPISYGDRSYDNHMLTNETAAGALTVKIHRDPSNLVKIGNDTSIVRAPVLPGNSLVVSSGSTLGTASAGNEEIFVSGLLYSGRLEPAVGQARVGSGKLVTSTAEGGAGAADADNTFYSLTARTDVPAITFGRYHNSQTTAGTWAAALDQFQLGPLLNSNKLNIQNYSSSGTWTKPENLRGALVICIGGGGGGGVGDSTSGDCAMGAGGGGGGCAIEYFNEVELGDTEDYTVGAGGAGDSTVGGAGVTGGASDFGTSAYLTANGGVGGTSTGNSSVGSQLGGAGGTATGGDINFAGGDGFPGSYYQTNFGIAGSGGSSIVGHTTRGGSVIQATSADAGDAAVDGTGGGGGGGVSTNETTAAGGDGGDGVVIVMEFLN